MKIRKLMGVARSSINRRLDKNRVKNQSKEDRNPREDRDPWLDMALYFLTSKKNLLSLDEHKIGGLNSSRLIL